MQELAGYQVVSELGRGASGTVFKALDASGEPVAVKLLLGGQALSEARQRRFRREAEAHLLLDHPHVVRVREARLDRGRAVLVMDLVEGENLEQRLRRGGPLSSRPAARLGYKLALALDYVHRRGVLHRDLKPENVLLDAEGEPLLTDFGLAKQLDTESSRLTRSGSFLGTPGYWPPEQALGEVAQFGPRSDVYGLGAVLYALLTALPPHEVTTIEDWARAASERPIPPSSRGRKPVDERLEAIVMRCLEPLPSDRYDSAGAVSRAIEDYLSSAAPASASRGPAVLPVAAGILLLGGLAAALIVAGSSAEPAPSPPPLVASVTPTPAVAAPSSPAATTPLAGDRPDSIPATSPSQSPSLRPIPRPSRTRTTVERMRQRAAANPDDLDARAFVAMDLITGQVVADEAMAHALAVLERTTEASPIARGMSHYVRGFLRARQGDPEGALEDMNASLSLFPDNAQALHYRSGLRAKLGDMVGAGEDAGRVIADGKQRPAALGEAHLWRGLAREEAGDLRGAAEDYRDSARLLPPGDPTRAIAVELLARLREHLPD